MSDLVVTLPEARLAEAVTAPDGVAVEVWDPARGLDDVARRATVVVPPYAAGTTGFEVLGHCPTCAWCRP
ncbi:hypothetical protein GCM10025868_39710 [Angustibacter aerolatus]|uniref:Uncharacterized protein n=1 Tax=Angustibacter aerolatus TaxID=1162965 RepID=A0ABQ6JKC3_9ACTN|nr:hypothetical protein [Angustibacter aerolatus]GMA88721.1 hypothetical protein GCM10025868_39710 [Angustibacter aerolatus]